METFEKLLKFFGTFDTLDDQIAIRAKPDRLFCKGYRTKLDQACGFWCRVYTSDKADKVCLGRTSGCSQLFTATQVAVWEHLKQYGASFHCSNFHVPCLSNLSEAELQPLFESLVARTSSGFLDIQMEGIRTICAFLHGPSAKMLLQFDHMLLPAIQRCLSAEPEETIRVALVCLRVYLKARIPGHTKALVTQLDALLERFPERSKISTSNLHEHLVVCKRMLSAQQTVSSI